LWNGYPAVNMAIRLLCRLVAGVWFAYNADIQSDPDGDGVNLLQPMHSTSIHG